MIWSGQQCVNSLRLIVINAIHATPKPQTVEGATDLTVRCFARAC